MPCVTLILGSMHWHVKPLRLIGLPVIVLLVRVSLLLSLTLFVRLLFDFYVNIEVLYLVYLNRVVKHVGSMLLILLLILRGELRSTIS